MSFLSPEELSSFGFKFVGKNVCISRKASICNPSKVSVDSNAKIDDFSTMSAETGGITIGKYVHTYSVL